MQIEDLIWEDCVIKKILAKHAVTRDEVEEVIYESDLEARKGGKNRYLICGQTCAGRYLMVVISRYKKGTTFKVLTARDMRESEKKAFKKGRKR